MSKKEFVVEFIRELIDNRIEELEREIKYEKEHMECCGYGKAELLELKSLEDELYNLNELEMQIEEYEMGEYELEEQINKLKECYESNKRSLMELENHIEEYGVADNGLENVNESFEQGWNNAMEFVFKTLEIEY